MTTRCVLLDFGNVIAFFDHRKACRQLAELSSPALDADYLYRAIFESGLETGNDTGRISSAEFIGWLRRAFSLTGTDAQIGRAWSDIFVPNDAMAATIRDLKGRGLRLVLPATRMRSITTGSHGSSLTRFRLSTRRCSPTRPVPASRSTRSSPPASLPRSVRPLSVSTWMIGTTSSRLAASSA
jgi:hypothetical protein